MEGIHNMCAGLLSMCFQATFNLFMHFVGYQIISQGVRNMCAGSLSTFGWSVIFCAGSKRDGIPNVSQHLEADKLAATAPMRQLAPYAAPAPEGST